MLGIMAILYQIKSLIEFSCNMIKGKEEAEKNLDRQKQEKILEGHEGRTQRCGSTNPRYRGKPSTFHVKELLKPKMT